MVNRILHKKAKKIKDQPQMTKKRNILIHLYGYLSFRKIPACRECPASQVKTGFVQKIDQYQSFWLQILT